MKNFILSIFKKSIILVILLGFLISISSLIPIDKKADKEVLSAKPVREDYWLLLFRKSNVEYLYKGNPGNIKESKLIKTFFVKTGIPNESPTPLPKILGKNYWLIVDKKEEIENPETAPYFLTLDIPVSEYEPFGPTPYLECNGQCNWNLPGYFGLHGVNGNNSKLSKEDPGSSGCIRHRDSDITFLYNLLDPKEEEIRYYIEDK